MKTRTVVITLVILAVIGILWVYRSKQVSVPQEVQENPTLTNGSSNSDLDQDMATIDAQLTAVEQGSTEVDQSFIDQSTLK